MCKSSFITIHWPVSLLMRLLIPSSSKDWGSGQELPSYPGLGIPKTDVLQRSPRFEMLCMSSRSYFLPIFASVVATVSSMPCWAHCDVAAIVASPHTTTNLPTPFRPSTDLLSVSSSVTQHGAAPALSHRQSSAISRPSRYVAWSYRPSRPTCDVLTNVRCSESVSVRGANNTQHHDPDDDQCRYSQRRYSRTALRARDRRPRL